MDEATRTWPKPKRCRRLYLGGWGRERGSRRGYLLTSFVVFMCSPYADLLRDDTNWKTRNKAVMHKTGGGVEELWVDFGGYRYSYFVHVVDPA